MRRVVRDGIAAALERERPALEEYIAAHLQYPEGFPYRFGRAAVLIREIRTLKVAALAKADLPAVRVEAVVKAWLFARESRVRDGWGPGVFDVDVQLTAHATVTPDGRYNVQPCRPR